MYVRKTRNTPDSQTNDHLVLVLPQPPLYCRS